MPSRSSMNKSKAKSGAKPSAGSSAPVTMPYASRHAVPAEVSRTLWWIGIIVLLVSVVSSLLLVLDHFGGLELPGCGKGSPCAAAANSVWGKIPIGEHFAWPVSFLGFAYFFGALVAWLASARAVAPLFRQIARFGAAVSVFFLVIIVVFGFHCKYCLAAHAGNLAFWIVMERTRRGPTGTLRPVGALAGLFVAASLVLLVAEVNVKAKVQAAQQKDLQESIGAITASDAQKRSKGTTQAPAPSATSQPARMTVGTNEASIGNTDRPTMAVVDFDVAGSPRGSAGRALADLARAAVQKSGRYTLLDRENMKSILGEEDFASVIQCDDDKCLVEYGKKLRAQKMLHGRVNEIGLTRVFTIAVTDVATSSVEAMRTYKNSERIEGLTGVVEQMAGELLRDALGEKSAGNLATSAATGGTPVQAQSGGKGSADSSSPSIAQEQRPWSGGFRGRWLYGPEKVPVRIVMYTDYQCPDCKRVEDDVRTMLQQRQDVSLSIKHFPMCAACNPAFAEANFHPNACWAARAAEAAAIIGGNDGFWKMHFWLFDHKGSFTDAELKQALPGLGFEAAQFIQIMMSEQTLTPIKSDIQEAMWLGLHFTPMVFINGVELRGVFAARAVSTAVAQVAAKNPPAMNHDLDQPPPGFEKCIGDWRENPLVMLPPDVHTWAIGPADAKVKIEVWGDYQEEGTATADRIIRKWMAGKPNVRYNFRHFPFNFECNPSLSEKAPKHPQACRAALAAEAAGQVGGLDGHWKMHDWLMEHPKPEQFTDDALRQAAAQIGLDPGALFTAMAGADAAAAVQEDVVAAKLNPKTGGGYLFRGGIPTIYVNGKIVPRFQLEGRLVLEPILDEAMGNK